MRLRSSIPRIVIGEKSYGKGVGQSTFDLPSGSSLKLTTFEWLTPRGRSIHKVGIVPALVSTQSKADRRAGKDPPLDLAFRCLVRGCPEAGH